MGSLVIFSSFGGGIEGSFSFLIFCDKNAVLDYAFLYGISFSPISFETRHSNIT